MCVKAVAVDVLSVRSDVHVYHKRTFGKMRGLDKGNPDDCGEQKVLGAFFELRSAR